MARRRGGYQRPSSPAAASGPGALSQRTDGAVPALQRTGEGYGENKAVNEQQASAPISPTGPDGQGGGGAAAPGALPFGEAGAFAPTGRPGEPLTAGVDAGPGPGQQMPLGTEDPLLFLRLLHEQTPSAATARLIARLTRA